MTWWIDAALAESPPGWCVSGDALVEPLRAALAIAWPDGPAAVGVEDCADGFAWDGERLVWLHDGRRSEAAAPAALDAALLARTWSLGPPAPAPGPRFLPSPPPPDPPAPAPSASLELAVAVEPRRRWLEAGVGARTGQPGDGVGLIAAWGPSDRRWFATEACLTWALSHQSGAPADPALAAALSDRDADPRWRDRVAVGVRWVAQPSVSGRAGLRLGGGPELSWADRELRDGGMTWASSSGPRAGATALAGAWVAVGRVEVAAQGAVRVAGPADPAAELGAELDLRYRVR